MATFSVTTTTAQDAAVKRATDAYNSGSPTPNPQLTPLQFAMMLISNTLDSLVARYRDSDTETKAQLYQKASTEDQATIDSILAKYAGT